MSAYLCRWKFSNMRGVFRFHIGQHSNWMNIVSIDSIVFDEGFKCSIWILSNKYVEVGWHLLLLDIFQALTHPNKTRTPNEFETEGSANTTTSTWVLGDRRVIGNLSYVTGIYTKSTRTVDLYRSVTNIRQPSGTHMLVLRWHTNIHMNARSYRTHGERVRARSHRTLPVGPHVWGKKVSFKTESWRRVGGDSH